MTWNVQNNKHLSSLLLPCRHFRRNLCLWSAQYADIDTTAKFKSSHRFLVLIPGRMSMNILVGILFFSIILWFIGLWSLCWMGVWIRIPLNICPITFTFSLTKPPTFSLLKVSGQSYIQLAELTCQGWGKSWMGTRKEMIISRAGLGDGGSSLANYRYMMQTLTSHLLSHGGDWKEWGDTECQARARVMPQNYTVPPVIFHSHKLP